jgi:hypothetical protein
MTFGKASALALGFVGALLLGVWVGPHVREYAATMNAPDAQVAAPAAESSKAQPVASAARANKTSTKPAAKVDEAKVPDAIPASATEVRDHVKPLLNRGANVTMASDGFRDAEQFVTVARAARNTEIPFILLKHRVLTEGKSLATAIRESKPDLDATIEANRARAEAKSDMAKLRG